ncbi:MAG: 1-deoxy-D-xylulose-5-phosphate reductoisomerase [Gammaproteobacteria bacterium]|jgi:1-deoxy-D-xylulose-5-phosphate reductoisomerase|nr:1-deoxy-D-xylulose-5-phosphate reductoisomerase [Gammaproteobacteria bacterium]MBT3490110.1 1-deoxy-D-xylulose-5-phosphate reductoisomerase [Gammaproteobacteria bacterium]MBT3718600.1 1-deoxy-D-xylulose-5-phosphate reductoisomerase [Gammaproteobacteria bacterium]MBT3844386.1 1-deoxy-D-xylulose-5-phosphate reductoisomerase [Gammaproteobacteria bacterium]MBT3892583.1 1-deoxy-D-xylulose-5-phosphate reductoisomerase [Gammaproteobacteria bacterium]
MLQQGIAILGATGSIGQSTLDVVSQHPDRFRVVALTAFRQIDLLTAQCAQFKPDFAVIADESLAGALTEKLHKVSPDTVVLSGVTGLEQVATDPKVDQVMAAIVGAAGLQPTLAAVRAGKRILLANKESLVMAGALFMQEVQQSGAVLLPIDSEHNAIYQCLPQHAPLGVMPAGVEKILLTGSGGPFRDRPLDQMDCVTPEEAVAHPNWSMGKKISVDSATMMNKGLELIEACWLFGVSPEQIQVVLHPESMIHSMVQYNDGSVLAQMGNPDMRTPISYAMGWPERIGSGVGHLDLFEVAQFNFEPPDLQRYPCLRLASDAMQTGGDAPMVLNAANEVAVEAFLEKRIGFTEIAAVVERALEYWAVESVDNLLQLQTKDQQVRQYSEELIKEMRWARA